MRAEIAERAAPRSASAIACADDVGVGMSERSAIERDLERRREPDGALRLSGARRIRDRNASRRDPGVLIATPRSVRSACGKRCGAVGKRFKSREPNPRSRSAETNARTATPCGRSRSIAIDASAARLEFRVRTRRPARRRQRPRRARLLLHSGACSSRSRSSASARATSSGFVTLKFSVAGTIANTSTPMPFEQGNVVGRFAMSLCARRRARERNRGASQIAAFARPTALPRSSVRVDGHRDGVDDFDRIDNRRREHAPLGPAARARIPARTSSARTSGRAPSCTKKALQRSTAPQGRCDTLSWRDRAARHDASVCAAGASCARARASARSSRLRSRRRARRSPASRQTCAATSRPCGRPASSTNCFGRPKRVPRPGGDDDRSPDALATIPPVSAERKSYVPQRFATRS